MRILAATRSLRQPALAVILCILASTLLRAQDASPTQSPPDRAEALRVQIESFTDHHAPPAQLGLAWIQLGAEYQNQFNLPGAERAFTKAINLLDLPSTQSLYADALDRLGALYFQTARPTEASNCLRRSLTLYQTLDDPSQSAKVHVTLAFVLFTQRQFQPSESHALEAIRLLQSQPHPDPADLAAAYLAHSYILAHRNQHALALQEIDQALTVTRAAYPPNSPELASILLTKGAEQWRAGSPALGEQFILDSLHILTSRTDLPRALILNAQIVALRQYIDCLRAAHRQPEATRLEAQLADLQSQQKPTCNNCTINAAAIAPATDTKISR